MSYNLIKFVQEEIDSGIGEIRRLQFILDSLKEDKPLYLCDQKYLEARISKQTEKMSTLKNETENVFKNNKNQNIVMMANSQDYNTKSRQEQQSALFLNKYEMMVQPDIQITILEVRKKLENILERIERLERNFYEESKFELITSEMEQPNLSNELHDFIEMQKLNNANVKFFGENKNKQKMDKNLLTVVKVLLVMTIVTIIPAISILWFFGTLEGKLTWQNHEITYSNVSEILHLFVFALVIVFVAWPALGIGSIIINKKRKINRKL
ncbi:MAG TPA: hypothetical protein VKB83_04465 [Nitrosopumilaceae archaeon]|nr:hypothetical protein [Nitrosopumilaceae archaeon]